MGGISVLIMGAVMSAFLFAFAAAIALFVAATVVSIVFAVRTKRRRERGKKLGGLIAIPIALYAVSIPILIFFAAGVFVPAFHAGTTTTYDDCSHAVVTHEPDQLESFLDAPDLQLPDEGPQSYRSLLHAAIECGDEECTRAILEDAEEKGRPIDLAQPLEKYGTDGNLLSTDYALCLATSSSFSSLDMVQMLIDFGADVNSAGDEGVTPLHNACDDQCTTAIASDTSSVSLDETDEAIDLLLDAGADVSAEDNAGETPWDYYCHTIDRYVDDGVLTEKEADAHLAARAKTLQPSE